MRRSLAADVDRARNEEEECLSRKDARRLVNKTSPRLISPARVEQKPSSRRKPLSSIYIIMRMLCQALSFHEAARTKPRSIKESRLRLLHLTV